MLISCAATVYEVPGPAEFFAESLGHWGECINVTIFVWVSVTCSVILDSP